MHILFTARNRCPIDRRPNPRRFTAYWHSSPSSAPSAAVRYDLGMILAAVDDLLFSSKIRTTAKQAGVDLTFARSPQEILEQAVALQPSLVIFDLNSAKANPIETIAALKHDPSLAGLRTLGFVS